MIVRIKSGKEGIVDYLKTGKMKGRQQIREELDRRVNLEGDLDTTEHIIDKINKEKDWTENYHHITLSFSEEIYQKFGINPSDADSPEMNVNILKKITAEAKRFYTAGFKPDEVNFYAEAHLPRLKTYKDELTGEIIKRYPHIHIVIPLVHLPSGNKLKRNEWDSKGVGEREMLEANDAFQELMNIKYELTSPKINRRLFNNRDEIIGRYKGAKKLTEDKSKRLPEEDQFIQGYKQKIVDRQLHRIELKTKVNNTLARLINENKIKSSVELIRHMKKLIANEDYLDHIEYRGMLYRDKIKIYTIIKQIELDLPLNATLAMQRFYHGYLDLLKSPIVFDGYMHQPEFWQDKNRQAIIDKHLKNIETNFVNNGDNQGVNLNSKLSLKTEAEYRNILSAYYKKRGAQVSKRYHSSTPSAQRHQKLKEHLKEHERSQLKKSLTPSQADQFKEAAIREYDQLASLYKDMKLLDASSQKLWDNAQMLRHDLYGGIYRPPNGRPLKLSAPPANDYGSELVKNLLIGSAELMFWTASCYFSPEQQIKMDHIDKLYSKMRDIKLKKEQLKREVERIRSDQAQREKDSYVSIRQKLEIGGGMTCEKDFKTSCELDLTKYENAKKIELVSKQVKSLGAELYQVVVRDKDGNLKRYKKPVTGAELYEDSFLGKLKKINLKGYEILVEPRSAQFTYKMSANVPTDTKARDIWDEEYGDKSVCMNVTVGGADCIYFRDSKSSDNVQSDYISLNGFLSSPWNRKQSFWVGNTCNLPRVDQGEKYREPDILRGQKLVLPSNVDDLEEYVDREEMISRFKGAAPEIQEEIRRKSRLFWAIYRCEIPEEILMDYVIKSNRYQGTVTYERPDLGYKIIDKGDKIALAGEKDDTEKQVRLMFEIALKKGWILELIRPLPESSDEFAEVLYKVKEELLKQQADKMFTHEKERLPELDEKVELKQPAWKEKGLENNPERYSNKNVVQAKLDAYEEVTSLEENKEFLRVVKDTLDPQLCLNYATVKYGLEKDDYQICGKHIIYGGKKYNVVDFFSKLCQMRFQDVTPLLKEIGKDGFVMPEPEDYGAVLREVVDRL